MATAIAFQSESGDHFLYVSHDNASEEDIKTELKQQWWLCEPLRLLDHASHEHDDDTVKRIASECVGQ